MMLSHIDMGLESAELLMLYAIFTIVIPCNRASEAGMRVFDSVLKTSRVELA